MNIQIATPIVSTDWLYAHLDATNLVILNGTIPKVINADFSQETQQIPNTRFFDLKKVFSVQNAPFPNTMLDVKAFTQEAQKLGIQHDSAIVVYDELGIYASPRVWLMFKAMGFDNIAVLDGGFPVWKEENRVCETKKVADVNCGNFQGNDQLKLFRDYTGMLQEVENSSSLIFDARSEARFTGKVPEPREGLRSGQIPNSKNLPYTELLHEHQFKSKVELKAIFDSFQPEEKQLIFSCGTGITACILALAAEYAGYKNYAVYDGSWTEWGSVYNLE